MTAPTSIPTLIRETKFKIQLGLIQSAQGDAGESARAFAAAFDLLDQIDRLWELLK